MSDWQRHDHVPAPRVDPPAPALIEACWRFVGPSQRVMTCGIYEAPRGVELRAGYSVDDLLRSQLVASIEDARELASEWRQAVIDMGSFTELDVRSAQ